MTAPAERLTEALAGRYRVERELGQGGRELFFLTEDSLHSARFGAGPAFRVEDVRALLRLNLSVGSGTRNGFDVLPGDSLFITIATARNDQSRVVVTANSYEQLRALTIPKQASR